MVEALASGAQETVSRSLPTSLERTLTPALSVAPSPSGRHLQGHWLGFLPRLQSPWSYCPVLWDPGVAMVTSDCGGQGTFLTVSTRIPTTVLGGGLAPVCS